MTNLVVHHSCHTTQQIWQCMCHILMTFKVFILRECDYATSGNYTLCKLGTTHITFIRFPPSGHSVQTGCETYHIYKVALHCECECVSSSDYYVETGHNTYRMYKGFPQRESEYESSGHNFLQIWHRAYHIYKVLSSVSVDMTLHVITHGPQTYHIYKVSPL